jgi:hypothetical protein
LAEHVVPQNSIFYIDILGFLCNAKNQANKTMPTTNVMIIKRRQLPSKKALGKCFVLPVWNKRKKDQKCNNAILLVSSF